MILKNHSKPPSLKNSNPLLLFFLLIPMISGCSVYKYQQESKGVNILEFGAKNNQISTKQIQKAIDYAAQTKSSVYIPENNTFLVSTLVLKNGLKKIYGGGILKGINIKNKGVLIDTSREESLMSCEITLNLDLSNGAGYGFWGRNISNCTISNSTMIGFTDDQKAPRAGIFLDAGSSNNMITKNRIIGYEKPTSKQTSIGIYFHGKSDPFAGFFDNGNTTNPTKPNTNNMIVDNYVAYGKVGIDLLACENIEVRNNELYKNKTRGIFLANSTNNCVITSNEILGFGSSAFLLGYGSHHNSFTNNVCRQIPEYNHFAGEAAINLHTGAYSNTIQGNTINSFTHYGVFMGVNMINNVIKENNIRGYYLAAIALENDFQDTPPINARYSRPNYGAPLIGKKWASKDSYGNVIADNIIGESYEGREVGSIYISQLGNKYQTRDNIVTNNVMNHKQKNNISLYFFEETPGMLRNNILVGNKNKNINPKKIFFSRGQLHFKKIKDNDGVNEYLKDNY